MTLNQLFWKLTKEKFYPSWGCCFSNLYFVQRDFFNICVLSQCILYWINLQNRYTFTYQKTLLHTLLLLVCKIVVSLHCILILNSNGEAKIECFSCPIRHATEVYGWGRKKNNGFYTQRSLENAFPKARKVFHNKSSTFAAFWPSYLNHQILNHFYKNLNNQNIESCFFFFFSKNPEFS